MSFRIRGEIETIFHGWGPAWRMVADTIADGHAEIFGSGAGWCAPAWTLVDTVADLAEKFTPEICAQDRHEVGLIETLCELHEHSATELFIPSVADVLMPDWQKNLACAAVAAQKAIDVAEKQADAWGWPECRDCGAWFPECEVETGDGSGDWTGTKIARTCDACRSI